MWVIGDRCGNRAKWVRQANLLGSPQQTPNETQEDGGAVQDGQSTLMKAEICSPQSRLNSGTFPKHPLKPPANRRRGEWRVQENDAQEKYDAATACSKMLTFACPCGLPVDRLHRFSARHAPGHAPTRRARAAASGAQQPENKKHFFGYDASYS